MTTPGTEHELIELRARVATLEQLLELHERVAADQTVRLGETNAALVSSQRIQAELIEKLRASVDELSTPMLEIWDDVLVLPVIGVVDQGRAARIMERLLDAIRTMQIGHVIIDLTGVEVVDTETADHFARLAKAVKLLGAQCVMTGIGPSVSQSMVALGVELGDLATLRSVKHALRYVLDEL
jgi:rsbT co-antagonist protein RsbR